MKHHTLLPDPHDLRDGSVYLTDSYIFERYASPHPTQLPPDNIRLYVPLDINRTSILNRLDAVITHYGEASEENESYFERDVRMLVEQIEIYDRAWRDKHEIGEGEHSVEALVLVETFIAKLEAIPDACAECFPFDLIDELRKEYGGI